MCSFYPKIKRRSKLSKSERFKNPEEILSKALEQIKDHDDDFTLIIEAIKKVGPRNCSLISRLTSIPIETVRHKIHKQLIKKGIRFHVSVDYSKLGLMRNWVTLNFKEEYAALAPKILDTLSRIGYLIYFGRIVPQGSYVSIIAFPVNDKASYERFLDGLIDLGILVSYEINGLSNVQQHFMKHEHYDFKEDTWNIDWSGLDRSMTIMPKKLENPSYELMADKTDLLILEQLQFDPTASFSKIAGELDIKQKTVRYHYLKHVVGRRLIKDYIIRWTAGLGKHERHSILGIIVQIRNISGEALSNILEVFHKLPFTWFDAFSNDRGLYLAYIAAPLIQYVNILDYLRRNIHLSYLQNTEVSSVDLSCSMGYTLPIEMFDEEEGWLFDAGEALEKLSRTVIVTKGVKSESKIKG